MPFRPRHDDHAIAEVAYALQLSQVISEQHIDAVIAAAKAIHDELPIRELRRSQVVPFDGPSNAIVPPMVLPPGLTLRSVQRDGSLDWMIRLADNLVTVNCGSYTRWRNVWPVAWKYLSLVCNEILGTDLHVVGLGITYIDEFIWEGEIHAYDARELLSDEISLPRALNTSSPLWHLHQGWFVTSVDEFENGRRLERVHFDGIEVNGSYLVRVESTLRHDFVRFLSSLSTPLNDLELPEVKPITAEVLFELLHGRSKALLLDFVAPVLAQKIGLGA